MYIHCIFLLHLDPSTTSTVSLSHDVNESTSTPQYSESSHLTQEMKDNPGNKLLCLLCVNLLIF